MDAAKTWRDEHVLLKVAEATSSLTGEQFFQRLVERLAAVLEVRYVVLAECLNEPPTRMHTLAIWNGKRIESNVEYDLAGTPCEQVVVGDRTSFCSKEIQRRFPDDPWLRDINAESFVGVPVHDETERVVGHLVLIDDREMSDDRITWAVLKIFAARAGAEISRQRAAVSLRAEKERAQVTLMAISDAVITTDADARITGMNRAAESLTGWEAPAARGRRASTVLSFVRDPVGHVIDDPIALCLRIGHSLRLSERTALIHRTKISRPVEGSVSPVHDVQGPCVGAVLVLRDVADRRVMQRQLQWQSTHDSVTGLLNRSVLEGRLSDAVGHARRTGLSYCLLYLDIDRFRVVNDSCGHAAGDRLLQRIAVMLERLVPTTDLLVRLGGDEFGILLRHCDRERGETLALRIMDALRGQRLNWEDRAFEVRASIGLTQVTANTRDAFDALAQADAACFVAKELGRNRLHVYTDGDEELARRRDELRIVTRIAHAIKEDRFELFGQPVIPVETHADRRVYLEVLVRMREGDSLLLPELFVSVAERHGLMVEIDRIVIHKALKQYRRWMRRNDTRASYRLAINLSGTSLRDMELVEFIAQQLRRHDVPASSVCFEITETAAVAHIGQFQDIVNGLRRLGCCIALDDFGCGLSSFNYLKSLELDYLKIYGGFVENLADSAIDRGIVEAFNQVGHVLGLTTVAEGVRDDAVLDAVRAIGVDYVQGYVLALPASLGE